MSTTPPVLLKRPPERIPVTLVPQRALGNFTADAVLEERLEDETEITAHPVEVGATVSDHAYDRPSEITLTYVWSMASDQNDDETDTFLNGLYRKILQLRAEHIPFKVITGKRSYAAMLISSLMVHIDKTTENVLLIRIGCREILMASTQVVTVADAGNHAQPDKTAPVLNQGTVNLLPGTNFNSGGAQ
jgi:hypothetical protein